MTDIDLIPRRWSLLDLLLVPVALFFIWRGHGRHRRTAAHTVPRERLEVVRAHGRRRGDWTSMRRAGWAVPTLAALALGAAGCEPPEAQPRSLTIEVTGEGLARIERTVDGHQDTEPARELPFSETRVADWLIIRVIAARGVAGCTVAYDGEVIGHDHDPSPTVAVCTGKVPGALE